MSEIVQRDILYQPNASVLVGSTNTAVIAGIDLLRFDKKTFTVKNLGPNAFQTGQVLATAVPEIDSTSGKPTGRPSQNLQDWEVIDNTTFVGLPANGIKSKQITDDSHRWWQVIASCNGTTTGAIGYVSAGSM